MSLMIGGDEFLGLMYVMISAWAGLNVDCLPHLIFVLLEILESCGLVGVLVAYGCLRA